MRVSESGKCWVVWSRARARARSSYRICSGTTESRLTRLAISLKRFSERYSRVRTRETYRPWNPVQSKRWSRQPFADALDVHCWRFFISIVDRPSTSSVGHGSQTWNDLICPVLKHGPRSLPVTRVLKWWKLQCAMKVTMRKGFCRGEMLDDALFTDFEAQLNWLACELVFSIDLSRIVTAGTRKMMNFARASWSRRKLRWRA